MESNASLRIDVWLHRCRFYKTRSLASAAVTGEHVRLNGDRATPGKPVRIDDRIDLVRERLPYSLAVLAIPHRRGPATEARACYSEDEAVVAKREAQNLALRQDSRMTPTTAGWPDKHTRRQLIKKRRN